MRGRHRSRPTASVLAEVRRFVAEGVKEINLISQDTTYYGMDLWTRKSRAPPAGRFVARPDARRPAARDRARCGRFLGAPALHAPGALERRADRDDRGNATRSRATSTCRCNTSTKRMLGRMRRETSRRPHRRSDRRAPRRHPRHRHAHYFHRRFPGRDGGGVRFLLDFIERIRFERLGIFKYSQEEGSRAAKMPDRFPTRKNSRFRRAMTLQQKIAREIADGKHRTRIETAG